MALNAQTFTNACARAAEAMTAAETELNSADRQLGDGDTGQTMRRVADAVSNAAKPTEDLGVFFRNLGLSAADATGSSLGTLVSVGLLEMGKSMRGKNDLSEMEFVAVLEQAETAMLSRGGAALGDKTALDVLHGVRLALEADPTNIVSAREASEAALVAFRDKECRIGRARIYAERSVGHDDPGMLAFVRLMQAIAKKN